MSRTHNNLDPSLTLPSSRAQILFGMLADPENGLSRDPKIMTQSMTWFWKLKGYITELRKGKKIEQTQEQERAARTKYDEQLDAIHRVWPQLIPQSLKNKRLQMFRDQTSSEASSTFTCAYFDLNVLKRPDLASNETNLLDRYKWLHPNCVPPPMPFDDGPCATFSLRSSWCFVSKWRPSRYSFWKDTGSGEPVGFPGRVGRFRLAHRSSVDCLYNTAAFQEGIICLYNSSWPIGPSFEM
ncbi:hypothetical protein B0H10DRAFT_1957564 [Mycena sp. CBHHK59/15]|nr:hypothetical protein B0H10DRAFT_1957564 [Mycena sp. CBHHK59/15]